MDLVTILIINYYIKYSLYVESEQLISLAFIEIDLYC